MKGFLPGIILAIAVSAHVQAAPKWESEPPEYYRFQYDVDGSGNVIARSVCTQYGGIERKNCRRYAQWTFAKKCWELGYQEKHSQGNLRQTIRRDMDIYCRASKSVRPTM